MTVANDPSVKVRAIGLLHGNNEWHISLNLTDRWGNVNDHSRACKPLDELEENPAMLARLREQMWDEITFVVRKDGAFGLLFEAEFVALESDNQEGITAPSLRPYEEVVTDLYRRTLPLVSRFPGVQFAIAPPEEMIYGRPGIWAFVPDGLLSLREREALGMALLNL